MALYAILFLTLEPSAKNVLIAANELCNLKEHFIISLPVLRISLEVILAIFITGFCTSVFTSYKINYIYVFQIDQNYKMSP